MKLFFLEMNSQKRYAIKTRIDVKNQVKFPEYRVKIIANDAEQLSSSLFTFPAKFNQKVISTRQQKKREIY